ncbi:hypothetical protein [Cupriavidus alkaliphilus]|uniref:hypothetical protein n=1 Tax=Cupriavidus alkaliphilus TaxID=942866 RepID=UPI001610FBB1|nr:hypothetical protein [Cupriavidus alkaliphilus]MBB3012028.1 hypothetical protein [Cupriavidus alkaliphilus]
MSYPDAASVAKKLDQIFKSAFSGKKLGRFYLTVEQMRSLAGRKQLEKTVVNEIIEAARKKHGLAVALVGQGKSRGFGVAPVKGIERWRQLDNKTLSRVNRDAK